MSRPRHPPRAQSELELVRVGMQECSPFPSLSRLTDAVRLVVCVLFGCGADSVVAGMPLTSSTSSTPPLPSGPEWGGNFNVPSDVAIRQIPPDGKCGWVAMAIVYLYLKHPELLLTADRFEVLETLKRGMVTEIQSNPSKYEQFACGSDGVRSMAEYQRKVLHQSYQTEDFDLFVLSNFIGINIQRVNPDGNRDHDTFRNDPSFPWCVLPWKGKTHYDLVYHVDSSSQCWTPIYTQDQALSTELDKTVRDFIRHQHIQDEAKKAEDEKSSTAVAEAMQLKEMAVAAPGSASITSDSVNSVSPERRAVPDAGPAVFSVFPATHGTHSPQEIPNYLGLNGAVQNGGYSFVSDVVPLTGQIYCHAQPMTYLGTCSRH
jgi:hypothetical protein